MPADGASAYGRLADALAGDWRALARPSQLAPPGNWSIWLLLAGRGFGKSRSGAEWILEQVGAGAKRLALVAPTAADVRDTMVEGVSGVLTLSPNWNRPDYEPSKRRLTWPNGAIATTFSADEPDRLRGPEHECAWCDEAATWKYADEAFSSLMLGLRRGAQPRCLVTTTPKPTKLIKALVARDGADVVVTRGKTKENAANLAGTFLSAIAQRYEGTRLGRQELEGELLEDVPGALWQRDWIDRDRLEKAPELRRIVVAIDPAVTNSEGSDETGIVVAGVGRDGHGYVLEEASGRYAPHEWAARALALYRKWSADRIVAEVNNGGQLVESVIRTADAAVSFKAVHASRGKVTRAEPISALYEQRKVHHVGSFLELEDQMCAFASDFDRARAGYSPDRLDALVWALTELMVGAQVIPIVVPFVYSRPAQTFGYNPYYR